MGLVKDDQAAGRVFCNYTQGLEYVVWTQNDGRIMGYVAGPVHTNVWDWWVAVHHNIGIGAPMKHVTIGTRKSTTVNAGHGRCSSLSVIRCRPNNHQ